VLYDEHVRGSAPPKVYWRLPVFSPLLGRDSLEPEFASCWVRLLVTAVREAWVERAVRHDAATANK
jgi:hypothetical protein